MKKFLIFWIGLFLFLANANGYGSVDLDGFKNFGLKLTKGGVNPETNSAYGQSLQPEKSAGYQNTKYEQSGYTDQQVDHAKRVYDQQLGNERGQNRYQKSGHSQRAIVQGIEPHKHSNDRRAHGEQQHRNSDYRQQEGRGDQGHDQTRHSGGYGQSVKNQNGYGPNFKGPIDHRQQQEINKNRHSQGSGHGHQKNSFRKYEDNTIQRSHPSRSNEQKSKYGEKGQRQPISGAAVEQKLLHTQQGGRKDQSARYRKGQGNFGSNREELLFVKSGYQQNRQQTGQDQSHERSNGYGHQVNDKRPTGYDKGQAGSKSDYHQQSNQATNTGYGGDQNLAFKPTELKDHKDFGHEENGHQSKRKSGYNQRQILNPNHSSGFNQQFNVQQYAQEPQIQTTGYDQKQIAKIPHDQQHTQSKSISRTSIGYGQQQGQRKSPGFSYQQIKFGPFSTQEQHSQPNSGGYGKQEEISNGHDQQLSTRTEGYDQNDQQKFEGRAAGYGHQAKTGGYGQGQTQIKFGGYGRQEIVENNRNHGHQSAHGQTRSDGSGYGTNDEKNKQNHGKYGQEQIHARGFKNTDGIPGYGQELTDFGFAQSGRSGYDPASDLGYNIILPEDEYGSKAEWDFKRGSDSVRYNLQQVHPDGGNSNVEFVQSTTH